MDSSLFAGASLVVSFFGGMIMLFAPCCITLMLPAYLGTVFKARYKVMFMTLIFALGVASVMLPLVLGARFIASFANANHFYLFAFGSLAMIGIGMMALFNKTIKLPFVSRLHSPQATGVVPAYTLGMVSGLLSTCCAPVLLGALTLSALSPSLLQAAGVGLAYTLGMVFPLFVMSLVIKRGVPKLFLKLQKRFLRFGNLRVSLANFAAFLIFTITGLVMFALILTNNTGTGMSPASLKVAETLRDLANTIAKPFEQAPFLSVVFVVLLVGFFIYVFRLLRQEKEVTDKKKPKNV